MTETPIVDGYDLAHSDARGALNAQIYRPRGSRKTWALCFARCEGAYATLQGKYETPATKREAVALLEALLTPRAARKP